MNIKWTEEERKYIADNAAHMKDRELAERLTEISDRKITVDAVRKVRQKMGIKKSHGRGICKIVYKENNVQDTKNSND
jgi:hypothetical protein|tara:strand:+ start:120 stop:353 length:234 start_codon:yes stop_codon:yes gene_type:complete